MKKERVVYQNEAQLLTQVGALPLTFGPPAPGYRRARWPARERQNPMVRRT